MGGVFELVLKAEDDREANINIVGDWRIPVLRVLKQFKQTNKQTNNNDLLEKDGGTKNCI